MKNNLIRTSIIMLALIAFGAGVGVFTARQQAAQQPPQIQGFLWPEPKELQAFSVVDHANQEFNLDNIRGKWSFLFFGYTNCPDICPITLAVYSQLYDKLQASKTDEAVQMVFVSVDPDRDKPEQIGDYVSYFNKDFIGLGGSAEQIETLTRQIGIAFFREAAADDGSYLVDHSAAIFLVNPDAQLVAILSAPHKAEVLYDRFLKIQSFLSGRNPA